MGWSIGYDTNLKRDIGYGVPALCDHPQCNELIDRGLGYVCGSEPFGGENGCGMHFCEKHLHCPAVYAEDEHYGNVCERCLNEEDQFPIKPDCERWVLWKRCHPSWAEWRSENDISEPKVLFLPIKKQWFDLIETGEKLEEYREFNSYWSSRLKGKHFDIVEFRNGYGKSVPSIRVILKSISIGVGLNKWGAKPNAYTYILKLGGILS